ncbi:hypothetical protein BJ742DRAFT_869650 [Cladochytrium replicatum]|nr:hypothetical protein BJ742DRAFT_869650 [Cladochytrium replicatum]
MSLPPPPVVLENEHFTVERTDPVPDQTLFRFNDLHNSDPSSPITYTIIPLKSLGRTFCPGGVPRKSLPPYHLSRSQQVPYRCSHIPALQRSLHPKPAGVMRTISLKATSATLSLGYQPACNSPLPIIVPGLVELLSTIEEVYKDAVLVARAFHIRLEYCASLGTDFACIQIEEIFSGWVGSKTRHFTYRGKGYFTFASGGLGFVAYKPGGLYLHHKPGNYTLCAATRTGPSTSGGRISWNVG